LSTKWTDIFNFIYTLDEPPRSGRVSRIVKNGWFTTFCFTVIVLNSLFMLVVADWEMTNALTHHGQVGKDLSFGFNVYTVLNSTFNIFYLCELLMKLYVHRLYFFWNSDYRWNTFDLLLICVAVFDDIMALIKSIDPSQEKTADGVNLTFLRILRILKLAKIFRVLRAIKHVQELRLLFECVLHSMAQLVWSMVMIFFVLYLFSMIFLRALAGYIDDNYDILMAPDNAEGHQYVRAVEDGFGSTWRAVISLFQATTGGADWNEQYLLIKDTGGHFEMTYLFFICFFVIVAWNIVTSVFVDKALKLAMPDIDQLILEKQKRDAENATELMCIIKDSMDVDHDGYVSYHEFAKQIKEPHVQEFFAIRGLELNDAQTFFKMIEEASGGADKSVAVDLETFVGCIMRLQGMASSVDLQTLFFETRKMHAIQSDLLLKVADRITNIEKHSRRRHNTYQCNDEIGVASV